MKWMYGKQDWKTRERGLENCYLMTNGLGGFSSMTMTGAVSRNDHALLMACTTAPNCRYNMIHRLKEELLTETGDVLTLSTQEFEEQTPELTLLDITLPDNSDLTLLRTMIKIRPEAKIVMNSAIGQELIIQDALNAGARDFITKPFKEKEFIEKIVKVMKGN